MVRMRSALLALFLIGCGTSYYSPPQDPVLVANPEQPAEIRAAVVRALADRRFVAEQEQEGRIMARHEKGDATLRVAVEYDGAHYQLKYVNSAGYKTQPAPDGSMVIETRGMKEMKNLQAAIDREIQRPAKEAAEREQHEREYRLMIEQQKTARAQANADAAQANLQAQQQQQQPQVVVPVPVPQPGAVNLQSSTSTTQGSQSITCCINGAFYNCPSQDAFRQCMSSNPRACTRDPSHSCR
jgi:hypothetical protein